MSALLRAGLSVTLLQDYFNSARTFLIEKLGTTTSVPLLPDATHVMTFANYRQLQAALASGAVPPNVRYILYDNEHWAATPAAEQVRPITYAAAAEQVAHQHGRGLIFTPAANLSTVLSSSYDNNTKYTGYLDLSLAAEGARVSDVFEIQAQQDEGLSGFTSFVAGAVDQALDRQPESADPAGTHHQCAGPVGHPEAPTHDYAATRSQVSGYWLNIPGGTPHRPRSPQVAVEFLEALAPQLGY